MNNGKQVCGKSRSGEKSAKFYVRRTKAPVPMSSDDFGDLTRSLSVVGAFPESTRELSKVAEFLSVKSCRGSIQVFEVNAEHFLTD